MSDRNQVIECYRTFANELDADTCCKRIRVVIRRMKGEESLLTHELHFMLLATQLMRETKTYGIYIATIQAYIANGNFDAALLTCDAMVQHETMLHEILVGGSLKFGATIN